MTMTTAAVYPWAPNSASASLSIPISLSYFHPSCTAAVSCQNRKSRSTILRILLWLSIAPRVYIGPDSRRDHMTYENKEKGTLVAGDAGPVTRGLGSLGEDLASFYQEI